MGVLLDTITAMSSAHDQEMLDGIRRYEARLMALLTQDQLETYAEHIRRTGEIRIFDEMTPAELADLPSDVVEVAAIVLEDPDACMENRRMVALLNQRGEHAVAPDLGPTIETADGILTAPKRQDEAVRP